MYNSKMNFKMNDKNKAPFKVEDVNWDELSGIGILKDELEQAGDCLLYTSDAADEL